MKAERTGSTIESLAVTVEKKRAQKYQENKGLEVELRTWLICVLLKDETDLPDNAIDMPLATLLKDGVVLCKCVNALCPGLIRRVNVSAIQFKQMENISNFISACQKLGLESTDIFDTVDLYEGKDIMKVLNCVSKLRIIYEKNSPEDIKNLVSNKGGPKHRSRSGVYSRSAVKKSFVTQQKTTKSARMVRSPTVEPAVKTNVQGQASVSSLDDDCVARQEFKYSAELERIAANWMEKVLKLKPNSLLSPNFISNIKSGVVLCQLVNAIKPGSIPRINQNTKIMFLWRENVQNFLQSCQKDLGVRDVFTTSDLIDEKDTVAVINSIIVVGNHVCSLDGYKGPKIEDSSKTKNLWIEAQSFNDLSKESTDQPMHGIAVTEEEKELVEWVNSQLVKANAPVGPISNLSSALRSGVVLLYMLEHLLKVESLVWERDPKYMWQYLLNAAEVFRLLLKQAVFFDECVARDIAAGNVRALIKFVAFLRDKFDMDYLFQKILDADLSLEDDDFLQYLEDPSDAWDEEEQVEDLKEMMAKLHPDLQNQINQKGLKLMFEEMNNDLEEQQVQEMKEDEEEQELEKAEREKKEKEAQLKKDQEDRERKERERIEKEQKEKERIERERQEKERIERERKEKERIERERKEREERERIKRERKEKEEKERIEREKKEKEERERIERERKERERKENERLEKLRLERERIEKERLARIEREKLERERLEKERIAREEKGLKRKE